MDVSDPPPQRIVLVRHGRSAHLPTGWLTVEGVRRWYEDYDAAGLAPGEAPPAALLALAERAAAAGTMVASDLPRAIASAALLAPSVPALASPLLRELALETPAAPLPALGGARLPLTGWALVYGTRWAAARLRGTAPPGVDAAARERAAAAAAWLAGLARDATGSGGLVVAVTHASFRGLLATALVRAGWRGPASRSLRPWSAWDLTRAPGDRGG